MKAGLRLPWSNGPVEGQINRLKMLKRQMFGRAKLDLLSRRFLARRDPYCGSASYWRLRPRIAVLSRGGGGTRCRPQPRLHGVVANLVPESA